MFVLYITSANKPFYYDDTDKEDDEMIQKR